MTVDDKVSASNNEFEIGWRVLVGGFLGIGFGLSSLYFYSFGIFIKPLSEEFGWSRGQVSLGSTLGTVASVIGSIVVGRLVDKFNSVHIGLGSLLCLSLGFLLLGTITSSYLSYVVIILAIAFFGIGSTGFAFTRPIISKFERHRGIALGIVLSGAGLGAILVPRIMTPYVAENGWRAGYLALGATIIVVAPLIWIVFRGQVDDVTTKREGGSFMPIVSQRAFYVIGAIFFLASISIIGTIVHFIPLLTDQGLSPSEAGATASLIGFTAIAGRLLAGFLIDRFKAGLVAGGLFLLAAAGLMTLALGGGQFLVLGALIAGLAIGAEIDLLTYLTGKYFPQRMFGEAYGLLFAVFSVGAALGPVLYGYLFDINGNYVLAMTIGASLLAIAAVPAFALDKLQPGEF